MTRRTINIETLLSAPQRFHIERQWILADIMLTDDTPVKSIVFFEMTERDRAGNRRPAGASVGEEGAGGLRLVLRLVVHVSEDFDGGRSGR